MLNAFGIHGYYTAWSDGVDFPLAALLHLTGKLQLNWDGDNCFTNLSKEQECLSCYIEKLQIKEETHYDECKLYYEAWQLQSSGNPFEVGDKVDWTSVMSAEYKNAHGIIIDFEEEDHGFAKYSISGIVTQIMQSAVSFLRESELSLIFRQIPFKRKPSGLMDMKRILAVMKKQIERFGDISLPSKMLW